MKTELLQPRIQFLSDECLDLLLDEAERALLDVESRDDLPFERQLGPGHAPELRLAVAELCDMCPAIQYDLEAIAEKCRNFGAVAATQSLESYPQVLHLIRLSLEVFFAKYPALSDLEDDCFRMDLLAEEDAVAYDVYVAYQRLLENLKLSLC